MDLFLSFQEGIPVCFLCLLVEVRHWHINGVTKYPTLLTITSVHSVSRFLRYHGDGGGHYPAEMIRNSY